jgi:hypothetical protein
MMMNYDDMTDAAIKNLLIDTMKERESLHYVIGWLRQSYCSPGPADIERVVAIKKLQEYNSEVV